ncbi:hypothetical protein XA68_16825 [Ophiocordyceps unilateralis]|uniref:Glycosyltransferase 2-like domain-containing protein n=1 Tax=Ophiocordyceps unilateralis TaxID=268505 RepID=A0A2A9P495_OPHUN|nr:hypothetical protein XA68_16825 [Ophiocordyceps unilateralis]
MRLWRLNAVFWLLWLSLVTWFFFNGYDDPSSVFYDARRAYRAPFSNLRVREVEAFLRRAAKRPMPNRTTTTTTMTKTTGRPPLLCVGIPSISRQSEAFVGHAVGSLLDTLSPLERDLIFLVVLLADGDPSMHSAYRQDWLRRLPDEVLVYGDDGVAANSSANFRRLPARGPAERVEKMRLDHAALVETCRARNAPYFALVEDDVVASRDWFVRLRRALSHLESSGRDWIYLRLFYSEFLMGWNAEEWLGYSQVIAAAYGLLILLLLELRRRHRLGSSPGCVFVLALCLWMPAMIGLVFMVGRVSLRRLGPSPPEGVREMPNYGCCAQGLVFPRRHLQGLHDLLASPPFAFAGDQILEDYARDRGLARFALRDSVSHPGASSAEETTNQLPERTTQRFSAGQAVEQLQSIKRCIAPPAHDNRREAYMFHLRFRQFYGLETGG